MAAITEKGIRDSLMEQLRLQNKTDAFYADLVNDYMAHWKIKKKLIADIKAKGVRYRGINGNGMPVEKQNESIQNLQKTTVIMLKIISELSLREPLAAGTDEDDYL